MRINPVHVVAAAFCLFFVTPLTWWSLDRDPPYLRISGQIVPTSPADCGLPETAPTGDIYPGSCVEVKWEIVRKRECRPHGRYNVKRKIIDSQGVHQLPVVESLYGQRDFQSPAIVRFFAIPAMSPEGVATYQSEACFECNPVHSILPVCIDKPELKYKVKKLPYGAPQSLPPPQPPPIVQQ